MRSKIFFRVLFLGHTILLLSIFMVVLAYAVPESSISLSRITKIKSLRTFPEGWAFFTKDPYSVEYLLYKKDRGTGAVRKLTRVSASAELLFGIDRTARMSLHEVSTFVGSIGSKHWVDITGQVENKSRVIDSMSTVTVINVSKKPYYLGEYIIQAVKPIPWAWANNKDLVNYQQSQICKINVISH